MTEGGEQAYENLVKELATWADDMRRRQFLRTFGWAATAAAAGPLLGLDPDEESRVLSAAENATRVDGTVIDHIETVLARAIRQDDALGPQAALDTVLAQRNLARMMLRDCPEPLRPRLLSACSSLSRALGWMLYDLRNFDGAAFFYEEARIAAHEAHNAELGALVLCQLGQLAVWRAQPRLGIDHAAGAKNWAKRTDDLALRSFAADIAARAHAEDGDYEACMAELTVAESLLDRASGTPTIVTFYDRPLLESDRGRCLFVLGHPGKAKDAAALSLATMDRGYVRNVAMTALDMVEAHIADGDLDGATHWMGEAGQLSARNHSPRLAGRIHSARGQLERRRESRAVRELDDRLRTPPMV